MHKHFKLSLLVAVFLAFITTSCTQKKSEYSMHCVAFYNLENLFDTINQEGVTDEEFIPAGKKKWTPDRYLEKLDNMARVISLIGLGDSTPDGAVLLGVCELENAGVMEDLANTDILKDRNYKFVHYDSPYYRGMDVALFYQPKYFTVLSSASHELNMPEIENFTTRAQLLVTGILDGDTIHVIVNHWPSRRGGEEGSRHLRVAAAGLTRSIADSLFNINSHANVIVMGDLNDDPVDVSVKETLGTNKNPEGMNKYQFYNPFENLHTGDYGSLAYRGSWNLFDQILVSRALTGEDCSSYKVYGANIFKEEFLIQQEGKYKGYPWRTYSYDDYIGGFSDHLPVYIYLVKKIN
ncbi:MAG: endonuclease/exonuclease/phosphatase family protein [Bacteroidales bacterium]|nr:endonuclease/exonuclease/phosphatase family protein [Bacteroidales bacterium]